MEAVQRVRDPHVWKFFWLSMRKEFVSWEFLVSSVILLSTEYWIWPAAYFFLTTYRISSIGWIPWLTILGLSFWTFAALGGMIVRIVRSVKVIKAASIRWKQGVAGAEEELLAVKRRHIEVLKMRKFMIAYSIAHLAIPAYGAAVVWSDIKAPQITSFKHPHVTTPQQRLEKTLARWRARGIYIKFEHEE